MPILGLTSGKQVKLSQKQFEALMRRREAYIGGVLIELYDENKKPIGKIKADCIEFVAPDNSPAFENKTQPSGGQGEGKPFNRSTIKPVVNLGVGVGDPIEKKKPGRPVKKA